MELVKAYAPSQAVLDCWEPTSRPTPSEWMREHIYLSRKHSALPGPYSTSQFPWVVGVLDAMHEPGVGEIVLRWATQLGKTTLFGAIACYLSENDPANMLIACPDRDMCFKHWKTKLKPIIDACPPVRAKMPSERDLNMLMPDLSDHYLIYAWSGSPSTLSAMSVRYVIATELNLWDVSSSLEGDRLRMVRDRIKDAPNSMVFIEGKPHLSGQCPITQQYERGDRRTFQIPCIHCMGYQELVLGSRESVGGLKFDPVNPRETAYYQCKFCQGRLQDQDKILALMNGIWVKDGQKAVWDGEKAALEGEVKSNRIASFHLNSLYSRVINFGEFAEHYVTSWGGTITDRQAFWNGWLALPWEVRGARFSIQDILDHCMPDAETDKIRDPNSVLICTVDVQAKSLYYRIRAWGNDGRSYGVRYGIIESSGTVGSDFEQLRQILRKTYQGPDGREYRVRLVGMDARYRNSEVLELCASYYRGSDQSVWPIYGEHQYRQKAIVAEASIKDYQIKALSVDMGRSADDLMERCLVTGRDEPGYWALESDCSTEFARHFLSHYKMQVVNKTGQKRWQWVPDPDYPHDHFWDCERMQLAMRDKYGLGLVQVQDRLPQKPSRRRAPIMKYQGPAGPGGWR